jgi:adenylate cyclase class IV
MNKLIPNAQHFATRQERHDFRIGEFHIALKHSDDWGYHVEFDQLVNSEAEVDAALQDISAIADKLGLALLTPEEEKQFVEEKIAARERAVD